MSCVELLSNAIYMSCVKLCSAVVVILSDCVDTVTLGRVKKEKIVHGIKLKKLPNGYFRAKLDRSQK